MSEMQWKQKIENFVVHPPKIRIRIKNLSFHINLRIPKFLKFKFWAHRRMNNKIFQFFLGTIAFCRLDRIQ